ncbi:oligoendopeptidase F [Fictibacillus macauensis ZFHKF-1]|uniref:Oligopeptidase F n=1 Tax=Fictibacillus macauensis ZFHKF-1 TaxID=1196324 RepID=I8IYQ0_9BACL|nr:oligoendopeptidase F [Fictibacillus macauensis]EIT84601.1 oligoendopeptidase F [Fictibacillus macauensis ZFHKF-1]
MAQSKSSTLPKREELAQQDTWDLEAIYATDQKWEEAFSHIKGLLPEVKAYEGRLEESAEVLYGFLQKQDELTQELGKLYTYAHMRYDQDTTSSFYQGLNDRAAALATQVSSALSFATPEILSMSEERLQSFLTNNAHLTLYKQMLDDINRQRPHVLSKEAEALLADVSEVTSASSTTFGMMNNADLKFPTIKNEKGEEVEITHGRFISLLESSDRRVREEAFKAVYKTYGSFKNTFASTIGGTVKRDNFFARTRKFSSARAASLHENNIPETVYDQLVKTINDHLHLLHRYVNIRKRALGVEKLHMYDLYTPLVKDSQMDVSYEEAKTLVLNSLEPLGKEYVNIVKEGFEKRWIDVRENVGKRSGAYSSGAYGTMPYILLNWQNNATNLFTLTHEIGHSVHSYFTREHQPYPYADYSIFVAEVASTCNESLLSHYLLNKTEDKKEKLFLLNHYLEGFRGTVFRQTMFAEFEQAIHEKAANGEPLTPELLSDIYYKLNVKYFGDDIVVDQEIGLEWSRIPHFYYNYYVYQYATGFSAAAALSKDILEGGDEAIARYIEFLKAGSSDYPIEVLKKAGVDMTTAEPIEAALKVFEEILDEMEELLF